MTCYLETLHTDARNVKTKPSSTVFKLGNKQQVKSDENPFDIGDRKIYIETGAVDCEKALLLSTDEIKKAEMNIYFAARQCHNFWIKKEIVIYLARTLLYSSAKPFEE